MQFFSNINNATSVIAGIELLGLPFYYEPYRTSYQELFESSGLKKMLQADIYRLRLLDGIEKPVILDIGSHIGIFPRVIKHRHPDAKIYSLEPDRDNFRILSLNNEFVESAESFQLAVHESESTFRLVASDQNSWRSSLDINPDFFRTELIGNDSFSYDSYLVKCVSIDNFISSQNVAYIHMIGITVPGEIAMPILKGSLSSIRSFRPIVSISLYSSEIESVLELMNSIDYKLSAKPVGNMHVFVSK